MTQPGPMDVHEDAMMAPKRRKKKSKKAIDKKRGPEAERPSLMWPHLYDILRGQGMSQEKAARISNAMRGKRKKGRLTTEAGRAAAKARRAAKMNKTDELIAKYLTEEELNKVSTKAGMGYTKKRKARRKSVGVRAKRHRRIGRHRPLPRQSEGGSRSETPTARGRHGRS